MSWTVDDAGLVAFATRLATIPSVSGSERDAVEATAAELRRLNFDEVSIDSVGNCVGVIGTEAGPTVLIDGHIDSIPLHSRSSWTMDPFGGAIVGGRLYGLGICDQKASIAAAAYGLAAARSALGQLSGRVALVASVNEEDVEGAALASVVNTFDPVCAVTSEPTDTRLCIGQRGRAKIVVTVTGRACHAGHARQGINAAEALAAIIVQVRNLRHPVHQRLGRRDITCIDIKSLPYPSVSTVPEEATARLDCRFLPGETAGALLATIAEAAVQAVADWTEPPSVSVGLARADFVTWTGHQFSQEEFKPAWWTDQTSALAQRAGSALASAGLDPEPTHYAFCTNGSYLSGVAGIPTIGFGVGEERLAHQVDEYVTLDSLRAGARGFAAIASELAWGPRSR